jgi:dienelactone hydrolase
VKLVTLVASLALAGCAPDRPSSERTYEERCGLAATSSLPTPTGPYCVGKTSLQLVDGSREDPFAAGTNRELVVRVWYPASDGGAQVQAPYSDPATLAWLQGQLPTVPADAFDRIHPHARRDAAMRGGARYPVVLFSPGLGLVSDTYSALLEDLASHGLVVAAVDHPSFSGVVALPGGRVVAALDSETVSPQFQVLVADLRFVLDRLAAADAAGSGLLSGHLDLAQVGALGHSMGGAAAIQLARQDARVQASLDLDGSIRGDLEGPWPTPIGLVLSEGHGPANDETLAAAWSRAPAGGAMTTISGAGHLDFCDLKQVFAPLAPDYPFDALGFGTVEPSVALELTRAWTLDFLRAHAVL